MNPRVVEIQMQLPPEEAYNIGTIKSAVAKESGIDISRISQIRISKRSIDARRQVKVQFTVSYTLDGELLPELAGQWEFKDVRVSDKQVIIAGSGPAGLFAALRLLEAGICPVIIERGKAVDDRNKDIALLNRNEHFDPESNYAFGEGGAGTYSDGKLYTRSTKRGDSNRILQLLHHFGAGETVFTDTHAHLGTDQLPKIIKAIRQEIENHGGRFIYSTRITDLVIKNGKVCGITTHLGESIVCDALLWSTGHSASDNYMMLQQHGIAMQEKGFAMGIRIEHPQELINEIQYKKYSHSTFLSPATYFISQQVENRGVYSFCMCPGGQIVNASTATDSMVVNGMSNSKRNSRFANSGLVVEIRPEDVPGNDIFRLLHYQQELERLARTNGGPPMKAPAQALADFAAGNISKNLPQTSYLPGVISSPVHFWLPAAISLRLQQSLRYFGKFMHGFVSNEAIALGVESRTSSPVRILRNN